MRARDGEGEANGSTVNQADSMDSAGKADKAERAEAADSATAAGSLTVWRRDAFWPDAVHAGAPLAIWAGHFFGSYVFVAIGCRAGLDSQAVLGLPLLTVALLALTAGALGWLTLMLVSRNGVLRLRRERAEQSPRTRPGQHSRPAGGCSPGATTFRSGAAALSLMAVAWTAPPMLLITSCLQ